MDRVARVGVDCRALGWRLDDEVAGLVQHRMHGCVRAREHAATDHARLGLTPVSARNRFAPLDIDQLDAVARQQGTQGTVVQFAGKQHAGITGETLGRFCGSEWQRSCAGSRVPRRLLRGSRVRTPGEPGTVRQVRVGLDGT